MDPKTVRKLETKLEKSIADAIQRLGLMKLPLLPSGRTMQMMAKAAVAVYEAAWKNTNAENGEKPGYLLAAIDAGWLMSA